MRRLFLLYAILIFAKKAPQLIKDLLNIKGDNVGLKGLNIKNKMGEAALIGDKVKKGMMAAEGGIKKGLGAGHQMLKNALINPTGVAGDIKSKIGKGFKDGWKGDNLLDKIGGSLKGGLKSGKESIWDNRKDNWDKYKKEIPDALIGKIDEKTGERKKDNLKKFLGNVAQGADEFRKKDNTKGAFGLGRGNVDVNYSSLGQKFEAFAQDSTRGITKWAGLDDEKAAKNRKDRSILGLDVEGEAGGKKIKIKDLEGFGVVKDGKLDPKALDAFKNNGDYTNWNREKQLTFDKYTQGQQREDLTMFKQCLDQMTQVTQALANAKQFNSQIEAKVKIENPNLKIDSDEFKAAMKSAGAIDISTLTDQQEVLVNTMEGIKNQGYEIDGKKVSIANIDNALNKANEDYSKTTSELSDLKKKVEAAASSSGDKK